MQRSRKLVTIWVVVFVLAGMASATASFASHRWGCWKYANYYIRWYNGGTGDYYNIYQEEAKSDSNSWDKYTDLTLAQVSSSGTTDHVNAYNGYYGINGWLGIAEILGSSGCTVKNGRARLNMSYLESGYSRTNKKHVACQEIGHLFGLHHNTSSSSTCMNDSILTAPQPNSHDQALINSIY